MSEEKIGGDCSKFIAGRAAICGRKMAENNRAKQQLLFSQRQHVAHD
jgi:hypothetical protein